MAKILLNEKLKEEIKKWRQKDYDGASTITKRLLNFWFNEEHFIKDERFEFWRCQREAIEALIYLYEVCKYHSLYEIFKNLNIREEYGKRSKNVLEQGKSRAEGA